MNLHEVTRVASIDREWIWKWASVVLQYSNAWEMKNEIKMWPEEQKGK